MNTRKITVALAAAAAGLILTSCSSAPAQPSAVVAPGAVTVTATVQQSTIIDDSSVPAVPATSTQRPPPQAPTTQAAPAYSFPYPVAQGTSPDEIAMALLVLSPAANNNWGPNNNDTHVVVYAACEYNLEPASQNSWPFNCNIAFATGEQVSFWAAPTADWRNYGVELRTH